MTSITPPHLQGQIENPNPVELFWEKHRRTILSVAAIAALALGIRYGLAYYEQAAVDSQWGRFTAAANLDEQIVSPVIPQAQLAFQGGRDPYPLQALGLITQLRRQLEDASPAALSEAILEAQGTPSEPLLLWIAGNAAAGRKEWDQALGYLNDLKSRFPNHILCVATDYPVQYREPIKADEDAAPDPLKEPEFEPPVAGSLVEAALSRIQRQQEFVAREGRLYEPVQPPEGSPRIRFTTSLGSFTVALYQERAPEHVAKLLELARSGTFYEGQNIDEIARTSAGQLFEPPVMEFRFGLEGSKSQARSEWDATKPSTSILGFEDDPGQRELSHFPGTMAAAAEADGKSSGERYWINVNDCAAAFDASRVIVGRVVEGLDVIESIVNVPFLTEEEAQRGRGQPRENIRIDKVEVL